MALSFEWDRRKARTNLRRHRVSFREAVGAFSDPFSIRIISARKATEAEQEQYERHE
jgi:hypothetical protein